MKVRIWYKPDKTIIVSEHSSKAKDTYEDFMAKTSIIYNLKNCDYDDYDIETNDDMYNFLHARKYRTAWVGDKQNGISIDNVKKEKVDNGELPMGGILPQQ